MRTSSTTNYLTRAVYPSTVLPCKACPEPGRSSFDRVALRRSGRTGAVEGLRTNGRSRRAQDEWPVEGL